MDGVAKSVQFSKRPWGMTFVTGTRTFSLATTLASLLCLAACSDARNPPAVTTPSQLAEDPPVVLPPPAPMPPPPKPSLPARPVAKPAPPSKVPAEPPTDIASAAPSDPVTAGSPEQHGTPTASGDPLPTPPPTTLALLSPPPVNLIGQNQSTVTKLLGKPASERQVAAARVWDYRAPECLLSVFFYLDTGRNDFYVLHFEIDGATPGPAASDPCIERIRGHVRRP